MIEQIEEPIIKSGYHKFDPPINLTPGETLEITFDVATTTFSHKVIPATRWFKIKQFFRSTVFWFWFCFAWCIYDAGLMYFSGVVWWRVLILAFQTYVTILYYRRYQFELFIRSIRDKPIDAKEQESIDQQAIEWERTRINRYEEFQQKQKEQENEKTT